MPLRALSHRNYRLFWFGQLISYSGTFMQQTAQQWLVYRLTESALHLSIVGFVSFLPVLLVTPFVGVLVERVNKLYTVTMVQVIFLLLALLLAVLTFLDLIQYWHILLLTLLLGCADTIEKPARQTLMIELVGQSDLMNAIALHASVFNIARFVGPAVAGVTVASLGEGVAFTLNALSYLPVIFALLAIRLVGSTQVRASLSSVEQLFEGFRYVWRDGTTLTLMAMTFLISFFGVPYTLLLPVFAGQILDIGSEGFGLLLSVAGGGAVTGGILLAFLSEKRKKERIISTAMLVFSLALFIFSRSRWVPLSLVMLAILGCTQLGQLATTNSLLQTRTPEAFRGRVISIYIWMHGGGIPLGSLLLGVFAQSVGAMDALMFFATACAISAVLTTRQLYKHNAPGVVSKEPSPCG